MKRMAGLSLHSDYTGCAVLIYDKNGEFVSRNEISGYNKRTYHLRLRGGIPPIISDDETYSLLILTEPSPCEYKGRAVTDRLERVLLLYRGKEKERRNVTRFKTDFPASITTLYRQDEAYKLHTPTPVRVINISRTGVRLSTPVNALRKNDKFSLDIKIDDIKKVLTAVVINTLDKEDASEYGCGLVTG